ncbi:MAG TPA: NUDIX domain-containing protein, partial [Crenotrichaceae bacterium]|nr:NUDIX domain-containing protein [Crenotrichaceae bacterium]
FSIFNQALQVLLIRRNQPPYHRQWALPGGFVRIDEEIEATAYRVLNEKTPLKQVYLEQLYTFGEPSRDPRERVISIAYLAIIPAHQLLEDRKQWHQADNLPALAFDHHKIITLARTRLRSKLQYSTIAFRFLAGRFTLTEVQQVNEAILGEPLEKRNFRKQLLKRNILSKTGVMSQGGAHRPAQLYSLVDDKLVYW